MQNRLNIAVGLVVVLVLAGFPNLATSQAQPYRTGFTSWVDGQQLVLSRFVDYEVDALVLHRVETGNGSKNASIKLRFEGEVLDFLRAFDGSNGPAGPGGAGNPNRPNPNGNPPLGGPDENGRRPQVLEFVLDGDTLDTREGQRVQQGISALISPEIGPLFFGIHLPVSQLNNLSFASRPTVETVDGERLVRIMFEPNFPEGGRLGMGRPGGDLAAGDRPPGGPPGMQPGMRPTLGRPQGRQRPTPGPPGSKDGRFEQPAIERTVVWFTEDMSRIVMSTTDLDLPGDRKLQIRTTYSRVEGLDVPTMRTVHGKFAIQRRLRTTTVSVENQSYYSSYRFSKKTGTK